MAKRRRVNGNGKNGKSNKGERKKREEQAKLDTQKRNMMMGVGIVIVLVVVALAASMLMSPGTPTNGPTTDTSSGGSGSSGGTGGGDAPVTEVRIPLSDLTNTIQYFTHNIDGVQVKFFSLYGSDGALHTAFDACEVCYDAKKGYSQQGEMVVCNNCGNKYAINDLGTKNQGGGCWPGFLKTSIKGDELVIQVTDIATGKYLFA